MLKKPRLNYCYHAEFLGDDQVILSSSKGGSILKGRAYHLILSRIQNQGIEANELAGQLKGQLGHMDVLATLCLLEKKGYLAEDTPSLARATCAFWSDLGLDIQTLLTVLAQKSVSLETVGQAVPDDIFRHTFTELGLRTADSSDNVDLRVIITNDYQTPALETINIKALDSGQPWLLVKPTGIEPWLGPLFIPGKTGCCQCLMQRLEINRPLHTFYKLQKNDPAILPTPLSYLPFSIQTTAARAAVETIQWLYHGENKKIAGKIIASNARTLETTVHQLVKRPQCPACGKWTPPAQPVPILLKQRSSHPVSFQGGYREVSPEETLEKYSHHISPITGVVPMLTPYFAIKDAPIYNYSSGHNLALRSKTLFWLNQHLRSGNGGKGRTPAQARAGALCESLERYCLSYHGEEYSIRGSLASLGNTAIHPNTCMNYSQYQYQNRDTINKKCSKYFSMIPLPFDENLEMEWAPVYSLTNNHFKYLPACFLYAQYPAHDELNLFSYPDSNGCAAGNTIEEAILQGFLELVERDSVALWWYNKLKKPAVDLESFNDPYFSRLKEFYASIERSLFVIDLTADLGIPVFGAISHRLGRGKQNIIFAFGAHVDAKIALERALIEINQILPITHVNAEQREKGNYLTDDKVFIDWLNQASIEDHAYLLPANDIAPKKAEAYSRLCPPTIYESVLFCIQAAAKQGLETYVLDLTRQDIGLPVARVIIPGMRHFWQRLAPGRLYEVPVKMGWLEQPLPEDQLNPIGIFI